MGFYTSIEVSATGLSAERLAMDTIANNIANVNTTRTPEGGPFKRQLVVYAQKAEPTQAAAGAVDDANGYVHMPNVDVVKEMVDMMAASRAYEANVTAIQEARAMGTATLGLLKA